MEKSPVGFIDISSVDDEKVHKFLFYFEKLKIKINIQDRVQVKILYGDRVGRMQGVKASQNHRWMFIDQAGQDRAGSAQL